MQYWQQASRQAVQYATPPIAGSVRSNAKSLSSGPSSIGSRKAAGGIAAGRHRHLTRQADAKAAEAFVQ